MIDDEAAIELEADLINQIVELVQHHDLYESYDLTDHLDVLLSNGWTLRVDVKAVNP